MTKEVNLTLDYEYRNVIGRGQQLLIV